MHSNPSRRRDQGFTLVEIMVVIVILGLLAGLVIPNVLENTEDARRETTNSNLVSTYNTVTLYVAKNAKIPTWEDLTTPGASGRASIEGGIPKDAWGEEFIIRTLEGRNRFELRSKGPDKIEDTDDDLVHPAPNQN